jgi:hypothetical protein
MSQNDVIVLEANFEAWKPRMAGVEGVDPWLYYCVEQYMKSYSLSDDELQFGLVEGGDDGGADAIYFLVNHGALVQEDTELAPKSVSKIRLVFFQVKTSGGFSDTAVEKLVLLADDFLDLSKSVQSLAYKYNANVRRVMKTFKDKYLKISGSFPEIAVDFFYITGADAPPPNPKTIAASESAKAKVRHHLNKAVPTFEFVGAQRLWEQVQIRPAKERILTWSASPMPAQEGHVGLVKLADYYEFLKDESGELAEKIFESNVRGFQGDTPVNEKIRESLTNKTKPNFWLLNNGITIISTKSGSSGHLKLTLTDPQIVNGLQTSREVFSYFAEQKPKNETREILVRVIETKDTEVSDLVIRATNSQTRMNEASLRMTDPIHRKLEDLFKPYDLFYDRRKGLHKDQGTPVKKIISATGLAQAIVATVLQRPDDARARPGDYFKDDDRYAKVFKEDALPLPVYVASIRIMRRVDQFLEQKHVERVHFRNLRFYVAAMLAVELSGELSPSPEKLIEQATDDRMTDAVVGLAYATVKSAYDKLTALLDPDAVGRGTELLSQMKDAVTKKYPPPKYPKKKKAK